VLLDGNSLVVGYDARRGEPRGAGKSREGKGDCVDCRRCVVVCPTGIDIRNGLQMDCTACTACIDACDEVMDKLHMPRGLVRYTSQNRLEGRPARVLRPRVVAYALLLVLGAGVATFAFRTRASYEANLLRLPGAPFVLDGDQIRNSFEIHLVNKRNQRTTFRVATEAPGGVEVVVPVDEVTLEPLEQRRIPVFASVPRADWHGRFDVAIRVGYEGGRERAIAAPFLGP
jgi:cytochrome c oxidase accessory protein FixG